jgi:hypothetical protein
MPSSSHLGPDVSGLILMEEKVKQEVLRSLTLSKASPGAYSAYRSNMIYFTLFFLPVMIVHYM